jgi:RNA polymerase sigma factor (sigma-70 family)
MGRIFNGGAASGRDDAELLGVFATSGDERAFEVLVSRHGPLVLATCRASLRDSNDAEDAFQATFLVLARKAPSLRIRSDLAGWLHRVAVRVARQHRIAEDRRRRREGRAGHRAEGIAPDRTASDAERAELALLVHREVDRLPDRLRLPVIRCHLEGRSYAETASSLGIPEPTLRGRLARARALLRDRLARRGFSGALPIALDLPRIPPAVPIGSVRSASRAASWLSAGRMVGTGPLPTAYSLMEDALMAMMMTRVRVSAAVLSMAMLSGLATAGVWATAAGSSPTPRPSAVSALPPPAVQEPKDKAPGPEEQSLLRYAGIVLGPEGEPIEDAALVFTFHTGRGDDFRQYAEERARTNAEGRFEFEVDPFRLVPGLEENPLDRAFLIAKADGYGPVAMAAADPEKMSRNTFQQPIDAIEFRLLTDTSTANETVSTTGAGWVSRRAG